MKFSLIKALLILSVIALGLPVFAQESLVTITPIDKISTTDKHLHEGDVVAFKDIESQRTILGTIRKITPNGFMGEQAALLITNFRYEDSKLPLKGQIFIRGNEHKKYQEMADGGFVPVVDFIRGGEVILTPDKTKLTLFLDSKQAKVDIPVKIALAEKLSTCNDEVEVGDKIRFYVKDDVYKNGKLYIRKNSTALGKVEYVSENGWSGDNAQIDFKQFKVKTVDGNILTLDSPLSINGFEILKYKGKRFAQFFNYIGVAFRGKEIEIIPEQDELVFNVWAK